MFRGWVWVVAKGLIEGIGLGAAELPAELEVDAEADVCVATKAGDELKVCVPPELSLVLPNVFLKSPLPNPFDDADELALARTLLNLESSLEAPDCLSDCPDSRRGDSVGDDVDGAVAANAAAVLGPGGGPGLCTTVLVLAGASEGGVDGATLEVVELLRRSSACLR